MRLIAIAVIIIMGVYAYKKGFNPWLWILACGLPGLIILIFMPSAAAPGIDEATRERRRKTGNTTGGVLSLIGIVLLFGFILWIFLR